METRNLEICNGWSKGSVRRRSFPEEDFPMLVHFPRPPTKPSLRSGTDAIQCPEHDVKLITSTREEQRTLLKFRGRKGTKPPGGISPSSHPPPKGDASIPFSYVQPTYFPILLCTIFIPLPKRIFSCYK